MDSASTRLEAVRRLLHLLPYLRSQAIILGGDAAFSRGIEDVPPAIIVCHPDGHARTLVYARPGGYLWVGTTQTRKLAYDADDAAHRQFARRILGAD